jgi:hypothetical protein
LAALPAVGSGEHIEGPVYELMPLRANRHRMSFPMAAKVFVMGDDVKVVRVDAALVFALVVHDHSCRNRAALHFNG